MTTSYTEPSKAVPLKLYGSMVMGTPNRDLHASLSPTHSPVHSMHSDPEQITLAKESLKLLKSRHPQFAGRGASSFSTQQPASMHHDSLFEQCVEPARKQPKPKGHVVFNPISYFQEERYLVYGNSQEAPPPLYICPCKCGRLMNKVQLQSHMHGCELLLKSTLSQQTNTPKEQTRRPTDPLIELLNSVKGRKKGSEAKAKPAIVIERVLGVPVHPSQNQPSTDRQRQPTFPCQPLPTHRAATRGNIKCPICKRIFGAAVGTRHIEFCTYLKRRNQAPR